MSIPSRGETAGPRWLHLGHPPGLSRELGRGFFMPISSYATCLGGLAPPGIPGRMLGRPEVVEKFRLCVGGSAGSACHSQEGPSQKRGPESNMPAVANDQHRQKNQHRHASQEGTHHESLAARSRRRLVGAATAAARRLPRLLPAKGRLRWRRRRHHCRSCPPVHLPGRNTTL